MKRNLLITFIILFLIFAYLGPLSFFRQALTPLNKPFQQIGRFFYLFKELNELEVLKQENQILRGRLVDFEETKKENKLLNEQLDIPKEERAWDLITARVIGLKDYLLIDRNDLVSSPVISYGNVLVGKIILPGTIQMIHHPKSKVAVLVQGSLFEGEARGDYGLSLSLDLPPSEEEVKINDVVITSGLDGNFPRGLLVGEVKEIIFNETKTSKRAKIAPGFQSRSLDKVFIIDWTRNN